MKEFNFSKNGLRPDSGFKYAFDENGFVYRMSDKGSKPINPHVGNARSIGSRGAYFYINPRGRKLKIYQEDILKHQEKTLPIDTQLGDYICPTWSIICIGQ